MICVASAGVISPALPVIALSSPINNEGVGMIPTPSFTTNRPRRCSVRCVWRPEGSTLATCAHPSFTVGE